MIDIIGKEGIIKIVIGGIIMVMMGVIVLIIYTNVWVPMTLGLIILFINASLMLLIMGLEFIGMIYLVVYIGAICVLFLFVLILLNLRSMDKAISEKKGIVFIGYIVSIACFINVYNYKENIAFSEDDKLMIFNENLIMSLVYYFLNNIYLFFLVGLLLFLGILLPIMLTKDIIEINYTKKQELICSNYKTYRTIVLIKNKK